MILDKRQAKFNTITPPSLARIKDPDILGFESIMKALVAEFNKKYSHGEFKHFEDCVEQTISFLKSCGAKTKEVQDIELWEELIDLTPKFEAINISLGTALIKHHYPKMAKAMSEGQIYSHYHLTLVKEAVLYTMEYFFKEGLIE